MNRCYKIILYKIIIIKTNNLDISYAVFLNDMSCWTCGWSTISCQGECTSFWSPVLGVYQELHLIVIIIVNSLFVISITGTEAKKEINNSAREKTLLLIIRYRTMSTCNALYSAYDSN